MVVIIFHALSVVDVIVLILVFATHQHPSFGGNQEGKAQTNITTFPGDARTTVLVLQGFSRIHK